MGHLARLLVLAAVVSLVASCGADDGPAVTTGGEPRRGASSPFRVPEVPDGYRLVVAGQGTAVPDWGDDEIGTNEPFTVLGRGGSTDVDDLVVVSTTGFEGYQGGLAQASRGYLDGADELSLDGRPALFAPANRGYWADLVGVAGEDVAVRVTAPEATREELVEVWKRVEVPAERTAAPAVDPPGGLDVIGHLDADAVLALSPGVQPRGDQVPGPTTAHAAGWVGEEDDQRALSVLTLPRGAVDLAALPGVAAFPRYEGTTVEATTVGGRPAALVELVQGGWTQRAVWVEAEWGDTVVVTAAGPHGVPAASELQAVAMSVRPSEQPAWDDFVVEASGGPGLRADHGSTEVTRGTAGGVGWLLQTGQPGGGLIGSGSVLTSAVDPCLKLSNRRRACTTGGAGGASSWITFTPAEDDGMPPFAVVTTSTAASQVRVTTSTGEATAPLVPVPGTSLRAAVVPVADPGTPTCTATGELPSEPGVTMTVHALDADGALVACLGMDLGGR